MTAAVRMRSKEDICAQLDRIEAKLDEVLARRTGPRVGSQKAKTQRFDEWWALYPRKEAKAKAQQSWAARELDKQADRVIAAIQRQLRTTYKGKELRFIPMPSTYLNQERYNDATPATRPDLTEEDILKLASK